MNVRTAIFKTLLLTIGILSFGHTGKAAEPKDSIYTFLPKMPQFPGGEATLSRYISKHAKLPDEEDCQGYFPISFIICKDGKLTAVGIQDKASETWTAAEAAMVKVIREMPDWIPGEIKGKKVACRFYLPLHICARLE
ncbi:hypothetical protein [Chitinophaga sp. Cy-1792]|uniref:hypothetical protein n=1 Tax=Chitinophaga sp. Cy-1792 TaxID=2608339 RepID=UPI00141F93C6|nr:hypothetical protein [Chitinophaga sp. Cy-1792]NIG55250.1 hypothetical protein [Chitinophaga sp. Cy-1792]